jgi:hypothetical protein
MVIVAMAAILGALTVCSVRAQEPPASPAPSPSASAASGESSAKPGKQKYSHANDFLILGTVFNEKALSFAGVQLRIRRSGEKKFRWESSTGSQGDFAVRVPQGYEYQMVVHAKGFTDQTRIVDAKNGGDEERVVFRMELAEKGKK